MSARLEKLCIPCFPGREVSLPDLRDFRSLLRTRLDRLIRPDSGSIVVCSYGIFTAPVRWVFCVFPCLSCESCTGATGYITKALSLQEAEALDTECAMLIELQRGFEK